MKWDRYTNSIGEYTIYGWIERSDGQRDFVVLLMVYEESNEPDVLFVTSSAKYSEAIGKYLFGEDNPHSPCIPYNETI